MRTSQAVGREEKTTEMAVGDLACVPDPSGALWLPDERSLVVADLHLEKGSSRAARGFLLPPYDTRDTLERLAAVVARLRPRMVIALGDSFHDVGGPTRLGEEDRARLRAVQTGRDWVWIVGNHDREISPCVGGQTAQELVSHGTTLRHEPTTRGAPELAGHLHPVAKVALRGRSVRRRCFVADARRCLLPAFGAYAGGLNVCDVAFRPLFPDSFTAYVLGAERIYNVGRASLCGD